MKESSPKLQEIQETEEQVPTQAANKISDLDR